MTESSSSSTPASTPKGPLRTTLSTPRLTLHLHTPSNTAQTDHIVACLNDPTTLAKVGDTGIRARPVRRDPRTRQHRLPLHVHRAPPRAGRHGRDGQPVAGATRRSRRIWGGACCGRVRGGGTRTEAGQAAVRYWTGEVRVGEIVACVGPRNGASVRVARKVGFEVGGEMGGAAERQVWCLPGVGRLEQEEVDLLYQ